jgi:hypothetical protein
MVDRMEVCWFFLPFWPRELGLPMRGFQAGRLAQAQGWSDAGQRAVTPTKQWTWKAEPPGAGSTASFDESGTVTLPYVTCPLRQTDGKRTGLGTREVSRVSEYISAGKGAQQDELCDVNKK